MHPSTNVFTHHPRSVGESYWQHMRTALSFAGTLALAACACLAHALLPFVCERTGSRMVREMNERLASRAAPPAA